MIEDPNTLIEKVAEKVDLILSDRSTVGLGDLNVTVAVEGPGAGVHGNQLTGQHQTDVGHHVSGEGPSCSTSVTTHPSFLEVVDDGPAVAAESQTEHGVHMQVSGDGPSL